MTTTQPAITTDTTQAPPGKAIPGYEGSYRLTRDGTLYSQRNNGEWRVKSRTGGGGYQLWRGGRNTYRRPETLLEVTFGKEAAEEYRRRLEAQKQRRKASRPRCKGAADFEEAAARFEAHCRAEEITPDGRGRYYGMRLAYRNGESQCPGWCVGERNGALYLWLDTPMKMTAFTELPVLLVAPWAGVLEVET